MKMKNVILSMILGSIFIGLIGCSKDKNKSVEPTKNMYNCQCVYTVQWYNPLDGTGGISRQDTFMSKTETVADCEAKSTSTHLPYESSYKDCSVIY